MDNCSICLDTPVVPCRLECSHAFCFRCIHSWFKSERTCPLCRRPFASLRDTKMRWDVIDFCASLSVIKEAGNAGVVDAQYKLGLACKHGTSVSKDRDDAIGWFRLSADQGHLPSCFELGHMLWLAGRDSKPREASMWLTRGASCGHVPSQVLLAQMHEAFDQQEDARYWFTEAASRGSAEAQYWLYKFGHEEKALGWLRKAAEQGFGRATVELGRHLVSSRPFEAIALFESAARDQNTDAMLELAWCLQRGVGSRVNCKRADDLEAEAARLGHLPLSAFEVSEDDVRYG